MLFVSAIGATVTLPQLMAFWTGAEAVPPMGFEKDLTVEFNSQQKSVKRLPTSSTCSLILWLPRGVGDPDDLCDIVKEAVHNSAGFGFI